VRVHISVYRRPLSKNFQGAMSGLSLETCKSNLKSIALTVLELLAFNAQQFRGHVTLATSPFLKNFKGSYPDCPWEHASQI